MNALTQQSGEKEERDFLKKWLNKKTRKLQSQGQSRSTWRSFATFVAPVFCCGCWYPKLQTHSPHIPDWTNSDLVPCEGAKSGRLVRVRVHRCLSDFPTPWCSVDHSYVIRDTQNISKLMEVTWFWRRNTPSHVLVCWHHFWSCVD